MLRPITFDAEWLTDDMDITLEDMDRLGEVDKREVWHAIENAAEAHGLWELADEMRRSAINDLLGTTY